MKKSSPPSKKSLAAYASLIILLFFLLRTFISHRITLIDKVLSVVATPLLWIHAHSIAPIQQKYMHYKDYQSLIDERNLYKKNYTQLYEKYIQNEATKGFETRTAKLEKFSKRYLTENSILCKILLHRISDVEQLLIVNAGSRHGVTSDMTALYGSSLIGRVTEIYPYYSLVQLVTDKRSRVSVYCAHTLSKGIIEGKNDAHELLLSYVDCLQPIQTNDLVISAGEGMLFPEGFGIGTIASYEQQGLHYAIKVKPCYDFTTLEYCYLTPYEQGAYASVVS